MPQKSVIETIESLKALRPNAQFIALGQTALWDEPMKAVWLSILSTAWPDATLTAGVHDTDYFAKTTALIDSNEKYVVLAHSDGATRGLWSAAGEMSALFGSEDVPTRAMYERASAPFNALAASSPRGKAEFYADKTSAWGWRGIAYTGAEPPIAGEVKLSGIGPALLEQLDWAFGESLSIISGPSKDAASAFCKEMRVWVTGYMADCPPTATLSDLYQFLLPKLYSSISPRSSASPAITNSLSLFKFNPETATLPRFSLLDVFLNQKSRSAAVSAYNRAVAGGGMYPLDEFGEDALPFDVVASGRGRGTLHVAGKNVTIDWRSGPETIASAELVVDRTQLARLLSDSLDDGVAIVGKAITLMDMLASEFVIVFHETASGYTPRTADMNAAIRASGVEINLLPIVRLAYPTWDALATAGIETQLNLPHHLLQALDCGSESISAADFGRRWKSAVGRQREKIDAITLQRKPREIMTALGAANSPSGPCWPCILSEYEEATNSVKVASARTSDIRQRIASLKSGIDEDKAAREHTERLKGEDFRASVAQLIQKADRTPDEQSLLDAAVLRRAHTFDAAIGGCRDRIRAARHEIRALRAEARTIERAPDVEASRSKIAGIVREVQLARLDSIRDAFIAAHSLPHTQARPSAWWLPLIDQSGAWFTAIVDGVEARLEVI